MPLDSRLRGNTEKEPEPNPILVSANPQKRVRQSGPARTNGNVSLCALTAHPPHRQPPRRPHKPLSYTPPICHAGRMTSFSLSPDRTFRCATGGRGQGDVV
ncbi:hypothetical protein GCM10011329_07650 [Stakelama pacifica]|nr:hypothetical protein GCM10011329_07650 [Stakelama pacifica]